ncbi:hypothetical protein GCM10009734_82150 [Nonomuraea bangladeshensis]
MYQLIGFRCRGQAQARKSPNTSMKVSSGIGKGCPPPLFIYKTRLDICFQGRDAAIAAAGGPPVRVAIGAVKVSAGAPGSLVGNEFDDDRRHSP